MARPVARCRASRTSRSLRRASARPSLGASASHDAATARSAVASLSPPLASLRSGSRRYCSSPWRSARSSHRSRSSGRRLGAWLRQSARTAVRRPAVRPRSPAMCRASRRPSCTLRSSPAVLRASAGRTDGVVEGEPQVPDGVPDAVREGGDGAGAGAAVVQEQQVEVAARGQLAASVAADGDEGHPGQLARPGGEQLGEPVVGQLRRAPNGAAARTAPRPGGGAAGPPHSRWVLNRRRPIFRSAHPHSSPSDSSVAVYSASGPRSPVRTRTAVSTGTAQTLPSPILPVLAALTMTSMSCSASSSSTRTSMRIFGTRSTVYSAPR